VHQVVGRDVLEQEAAGTRPHCREDVLVEVERRQREHAHVGIRRDEPTRRLDAVEPRHPHVHENNVGPRRLAHVERLESVGGLTDHGHPRALQDQPKAGPHQRLVVDQHDAGSWPGHAVGSCARTVNPSRVSVSR
jgi:hypothetical protein